MRRSAARRAKTGVGASAFEPGLEYIGSDGTPVLKTQRSFALFSEWDPPERPPLLGYPFRNVRTWRGRGPQILMHATSTMFCPRAESNGRTTILYVMRVTSAGIGSDFRDGAAQQRRCRIDLAGARGVRFRVQ